MKPRRWGEGIGDRKSTNHAIVFWQMMCTLNRCELNASVSVSVEDNQEPALSRPRNIRNLIACTVYRASVPSRGASTGRHSCCMTGYGLSLARMHRVWVSIMALQCVYFILFTVTLRLWWWRWINRERASLRKQIRQIAEITVTYGRVVY